MKKDHLCPVETCWGQLPSHRKEEMSVELESHKRRRRCSQIDKASSHPYPLFRHCDQSRTTWYTTSAEDGQLSQHAWLRIGGEMFFRYVFMNWQVESTYLFLFSPVIAIRWEWDINHTVRCHKGQRESWKGGSLRRRPTGHQRLKDGKREKSRREQGRSRTTLMHSPSTSQGRNHCKGRWGQPC